MKQNSKTSKTQVASVKMTILAATVLSCLAACGQAKWQETKSSHTGDPAIERQVAPPRLGSLEPGSTGYISSDRLRGQETPDQPGEEAPVVLDKNEPVEIMDPTPQGDDEMVQVRQRNSPVVPHRPLFVPKKYLADKPVQLSTDDISANRYVVIENVATETLRVYERCHEAPGCANKLILETDMVVGQDTPNHELRTRTGNYRIESWVKFYEDNQRLYPSWMAPGAPAMPGAGQSLAAWTSTELIPRGYANDGARGAFGWFTAKIGPNAGEQWTHGTWGMGADGDKFIQAVRHLRNDERIASHGCTRVENQAIALMHELLPAGTQVIKVYAREGLADESYATQEIQRRTWDWIMTSDDAMKTGRKMSASAGRSGHMIDQGRFSPENHAHARSGNVYDVPESEMSGVFLVDEGRLMNYRNPVSIPRGGFGERNALPSSVIARGTRFVDRGQDAEESPRAPLPPPRPRDEPVAPARQPVVVVPVPVPVARPVAQRPVLPPAAPAQRPVPRIAPIQVAPIAPAPAPAPVAGSKPKIAPIAMQNSGSTTAPVEGSKPKIAPIAMPATGDSSTSSTTKPATTAKLPTVDDPEADTGSATTSNVPVPHRPLKKKRAIQN